MATSAHQCAIKEPLIRNSLANFYCLEPGQSLFDMAGILTNQSVSSITQPPETAGCGKSSPAGPVANSHLTWFDSIRENPNIAAIAP
jgi:hypothetical protein